MMEVQDAKKLLTSDDLAKLPSGKRHELIEGELIRLSPTKPLHGFVALRVAAALILYNNSHHFGTLFAAETGFLTRGNNRTVRAPDVAFISYEKLPAGSKLDDFLAIPPNLVVEVVSPGDRAGEIEQKTHEWLDFGVGMVWVVYPESQRVHIYEKNNQVRILSVEESIVGDPILPGFESPVRAFFEN
jgi:Uma2 family endonuclease